MVQWKILVLMVLVMVLSSTPLFATTLTECFNATCVTITAPEHVLPGDDFDINVEGYVENSSSWDVTAYMLLENAEWGYNEDTHMVETTSPTLDAKGFNWGGNFSHKYTLKKRPGTDLFTFIFGQRTWGHDFYDVAVEIQVLAASPVKQVAFDIKPQSCPNPLNINRKGVLSAAIVGAADFDVSRVDISSVKVVGIRPIHSSYTDVTEPYRAPGEELAEYDCTTAGPDGYPDLTLKFRAQEIYTAAQEIQGRTLKDGETFILKMTAALIDMGDGSPKETIAGEDVIRVISKK